MFKIYDGRQLFYQWDLNRKLLVEDSSITQVHFSNQNRDTALVLEVYELDGHRVVDVPNILLQDDRPLYAYAYLDDHTKLTVTFTVRSRPKPEEYEYTETEVLTFSKMMERAEEAANAADESAGKAAGSEQAAMTAAESADQSAKAAAESAKKAEQAAGNVKDGASAYEVAVADGFEGTEAEWLESLIGPQGATGATGATGKDGADGKDGTDGKSAYQYAVQGGYAGTEEEFAALLAEGGGGVNVTAEVGQTILVEEIDESGKPTKWKAVDYQPRTHWSKFEEIVPATEVTDFSTDDLGVPMGTMPICKLEVGHTYKVIFDGVEYTCVATAECLGGFAGVGIGNAVFNGREDTGEPFAIAYTDVLSYSFLFAFDTNAHSVRVLGEVPQKIPTKFVPTLEEMRTKRLVVVPKITAEVGEIGEIEFSSDFVPTIGENYTVTYNGVEYVCTWVVVDDGVYVTGNVPLLFETGDNGMPFCVILDSNEGNGLCVPLDGSTTVSFAIAERSYDQISGKYLPEGVGYDEVRILVKDETVILDGSRGRFLPNTPFETGGSYTIVCNGVAYTCTALGDGTVVAVGNLSLVNIGDDSGEPFYIMQVSDDLLANIAVSEDFGDQLILSISSTVRHKIPEKYLDGIGDGTIRYIEGYGTTLGSTITLLDDAESILSEYFGKPIILRLYSYNPNSTSITQYRDLQFSGYSYGYYTFARHDCDESYVYIETVKIYSGEVTKHYYKKIAVSE